MTKERRLGRGLEALLGRLPGATESEQESHAPEIAGPHGPPAPIDEPPSDPSQGTPLDHADVAPDFTLHTEPDTGIGPRQLDVGRIDSNPDQPRQDFDQAEIQSLSESLADHGLLQPVVVRRVDDRYQLIAGERRLRAAVQAGWTEVPVNVIEADDRQTCELAIVENLQRKDLNPLEKAAAFQRYLKQFGATQEELATRLKLDRSTIANLIRLLELPQGVQEAIRNAKITQGHARALLPLGEEREQLDFCQRIQSDGLNVRQTEAAVQEAIGAADESTLGVIDRDGQASRPAHVRSEHLAALEQELRATLGTKVKITHNTAGRGKMTIHFSNHEEFERLRQRIIEPGRGEIQSQVG